MFLVLMKKLKYSKKIKNETQTFIQLIDNLCSKLNKEYSKNMNKLLENIAKGENLDINMLRNKYLNTFNNETTKEEDNDVNIESDNNEDTETNVSSNINSFEEIIFDKIILNGSDYYYENKENGRIYNNKSKIVGIYKNNEFILN